MKESLIIISFSALLFASSGILSQPTDEISTSASTVTPATVFETNSTARDLHDKNPLILAKVTGINESLIRRLNNKTAVIIDSTETESIPTEAPDDSIAETAEKPAVEDISDEELVRLRLVFQQAEKALKKKRYKKYFQLVEQLEEYPLYPYLQYQWLKKHLDREKQVKQFLQQHSSSRYARILQRKWLHHLGKRKQWSLLLENQIQTKDATLNCYYQRAEIQTGDKQAALIAAQKLWAVGRSQPRVCDALFSQLKKSDFFTQKLRWQRFDAALQKNKVSLATYVMNKMPKEHHASAKLWIKLHRNPSRYLPQLLKQPQSEQSALMFIHAINRLASKDINTAIEIWDTNKYLFEHAENSAAEQIAELPSEQATELVTEPATDQTSSQTSSQTSNQATNQTVNQAAKQAAEKLERRLALKLVYEGEPGAYDRLGQLNKQDNSIRTWRIRIALSEQNWENVLSAVQALNDTERSRDKWQYWMARSYMETGEITKGHILLSELSTKRSFYGFLAADKVNSLYQLSDTPVDVSAEDITELKNRTEFRVAYEFMMLERKNDAKVQWWHAARTLNKDEILIAAKLAQQWQWDEIAIFTIAKAKYWDDIEVRFPLSYVDKIHENSAQHNLNPVILYGLIRRESAFNEKAHSPTGARGLMQIMPRTGKYIARNLKERWRGSNSLYNPVTNIKYGSYYYQKLLTQFDGHYAIALAAYNAGPNRVKRWLPETKTLPADIWIETIPYKETREYVTNVLAYALIYQQRAQMQSDLINQPPANSLSMNDFTRDILPLATTP